jgi:hypothetical protein
MLVCVTGQSLRGTTEKPKPANEEADVKMVKADVSFHSKPSLFFRLLGFYYIPLLSILSGVDLAL